MHGLGRLWRIPVAATILRWSTKLADLRARALRHPPHVEDAYGHAVIGLIAKFVASQRAVATLETAMGRESMPPASNPAFRPRASADPCGAPSQ